MDAARAGPAGALTLPRVRNAPSRSAKARVSRGVRWLAAIVLLAWAAPARADDGFMLERLTPAPAGAGWIALDALDMHGGLSGAASLTVSYAHDPLRGVVSDEAFFDIGAALTYDRLRFSLDLTSPIAIDGPSASVDIGHDPDVIWDPRFGFDVRFFGDAGAPVRLGWSAAVFLPNGDRAAFDSDGTVRGMFQLLFAGDLPHFTYAARAGIHARMLRVTNPDGPEGDEFLFGAAAGARFGPRAWTFVLGPEIFGETALDDFFLARTGVEGLLSARLDHFPFRLKLGGGGGLDPHFGAPGWRVVVGVELVGPGATR